MLPGIAPHVDPSAFVSLLACLLTASLLTVQSVYFTVDQQRIHDRRNIIEISDKYILFRCNS